MKSYSRFNDTQTTFCQTLTKIYVVYVYSTTPFDLPNHFFFLPVRKLREPSSRVVTRCSLNRLHEFHYLLSTRRTKIAYKYDFENFFKCRQIGMSGYLVEHLIENYQGKGIFFSNGNKVKMRFKGLILISGVRQLRPTSNQPKETPCV